MKREPIQVRIARFILIVLAYACLPLFGVVYFVGYWADRWCRKQKERAE